MERLVESEKPAVKLKDKVWYTWSPSFDSYWSSLDGRYKSDGTIVWFECRNGTVFFRIQRDDSKIVDFVPEWNVLSVLESKSCD